MKKRLTRFLLLLFGLPLSLILTAAAVFKLLNRTNGSLVSSGVKRRYLLYVPKTYNPAVPTPLVISIHGYAEWPAHQMQISRWNRLADQHGFIVVYPAGTQFPMRWRTHGQPTTPADPAPDVIFIADLINKLSAQYNLDPDRIFANGLSNGGGMSFVLACRLSGLIAAVGSVAGAYLLPWDACQPARPVPALIFHGTQDPIVPYQGGPSRAFDIPFPFIPDWVASFARRNGCIDTPEEQPVSQHVTRRNYPNPTTGAEVIFYTITAGGHSWPGGGPLPHWIVGQTTHEIDATQLMWDFFQRHPMPPIPR